MDFAKKLKHQKVRLGEVAEFTCAVTEPNAQVTWFRNGVKINPSEKFEIVDIGPTHTLKIMDVKMEDEGEITAHAELDDHSTVETAAKLTHAPEGNFKIFRL